MVQYHEALELIRSFTTPAGIEEVALVESRLRVLAKDSCYDGNIPPFNKSAMDGYACRSADIANKLNILETIYAGSVPAFRRSSRTLAPTSIPARSPMATGPIGSPNS